MPAKLHRCVKAVKKSGKSESSSWAICQSAMKKKKSKKKGKK